MDDDVVVVVAPGRQRSGAGTAIELTTDEIEHLERYRAYKAFRMAENYRGMMLWRYWFNWALLILGAVLILAAGIVVLVWAEPGSLACSMNADLPFCQHSRHGLRFWN